MGTRTRTLPFCIEFNLMNSNKKGFSLLSFIVYILFFSIILSLTLWSTLFFAQKIKTICTEALSTMNIFIAHDLLLKDLHVAQNCKEIIILELPEPTVLFFIYPHKKTVLWSLEEGHLIRTEGLFNTFNKKWEKIHYKNFITKANMVLFVIEKSATYQTKKVFFSITIDKNKVENCITL